MARIKGPLMSMSAGGALGDALLFRGGKKAAHVYRPADPRKVNQAPPSSAQAAIRANYAAARVSWQGLSETQRDQWRALASADDRAVSGWNLYLAAFGANAGGPTTATLRVSAGRPLRFIAFGIEIAPTVTTLTVNLAEHMRTGV